MTSLELAGYSLLAAWFCFLFIGLLLSRTDVPAERVSMAINCFVGAVVAMAAYGVLTLARGNMTGAGLALIVIALDYALIRVTGKRLAQATERERS